MSSRAHAMNIWTRARFIHFWTKARCTHLAESLRALALGVLVYYGFQAQHFRAKALGIAGLIAVVLDAMAIWLLKE